MRVRVRARARARACVRACVPAVDCERVRAIVRVRACLCARACVLPWDGSSASRQHSYPNLHIVHQMNTLGEHFDGFGSPSPSSLIIIRALTCTLQYCVCRGHCWASRGAFTSLLTDLNVNLSTTKQPTHTDTHVCTQECVCACVCRGGCWASRAHSYPNSRARQSL